MDALFETNNLVSVNCGFCRYFFMTIANELFMVCCFNGKFDEYWLLKISVFSYLNGNKFNEFLIAVHITVFMNSTDLSVKSDDVWLYSE